MHGDTGEWIAIALEDLWRSAWPWVAGVAAGALLCLA